MACFLLGAVETAAIGRMFARKHGYRLDSNQEFLALAGANLAAGLGQGFPTSGGMSQSLVNESSGARTPLSGFISSILILLVILFLSGLLRHLPQPVLAAIVLVAVTGLFNLSALKRDVAFQPRRFRRRHRRAGRRACFRPADGRAHRRGALARAAAAPRDAAAHHRTRPRARAPIISPTASATRTTSASPVSSSSAAMAASSTSTPNTCTTASSNCSRRAGRNQTRRLLPGHRAHDRHGRRRVPHRAA